MEDAKRKEQLNMLPFALLPWYRINGRSLPWREDPTPYHVWLSEIMLQQTRIEAVKPYYAAFLKEVPDIAALADADPEKLHKLWEGLGYYSRVRNLQKAAQKIMTEYNGSFPQAYEEILSLPGIGQYTAGAISSICFQLPIPAVDGNVLRVLSRITADPRSVSEEKTKADVRKELSDVYPKEDAGNFTQAIMELGETVCVPNGIPNCGNCPCKTFCASCESGWENFPVKSAKKKRRIEQMSVFIIRCGDAVALRKRGHSGLLSDLWEFPNIPGFSTTEEATDQLLLWNCGTSRFLGVSEVNHVFTHVEWNMKCFRFSCEKMPEHFTWATQDMLTNAIALPTAFRKCLDNKE